MSRSPVSEDCENKPSPFRLQHGGESPKAIYDEAHKLGIIDDSQHSDMAHYNMMRAAFLNRNEPRSTVISKMMNNETGQGLFDGRSLCDKYSDFMRQVPVVTQQALESLSSPLQKTHVRKMFYSARLLIDSHLSVLRKWLDSN